MLEHTWRVTRDLPGDVQCFVATDSTEIAKIATGFGAAVLMTSETCQNGTERCAEALAQLGDSFDMIVNLQGDAPLTPPSFIGALTDALAQAPEFAMATPVLACDAAAKARLLQDRKEGRIGGTTAVFDDAGRALYFSKEVIPHGAATSYHHVGLYAYRAEALRRYATWPMGRLEQSEGLEQLRFIENSAPVLCVQMQHDAASFWEVNNPGDIAIVENLLARQRK